MKISLHFPKEHTLKQWLKNRKNDPLSYAEHKATQKENFPPGYNHDKNKCLLGQGENTFLAAKEAIDQWIMFPAPWTKIYPHTPFELNKEVVVLFRLFGMWWFNSSRVIYTIKEPNRYGFAYGTLDQHVEKGEEVFWIERDTEGNVWYRIEVFSQPRAWYVKLFKPLARHHQKRFGRDSKASMQQFVKQRLSSTPVS